jgi:hypothetical protein
MEQNRIFFAYVPVAMLRSMGTQSRSTVTNSVYNTRNYNQIQSSTLGRTQRQRGMLVWLSSLRMASTHGHGAQPHIGSAPRNDDLAHMLLCCIAGLLHSFPVLAFCPLYCLIVAVDWPGPAGGCLACACPCPCLIVAVDWPGPAGSAWHVPAPVPVLHAVPWPLPLRGT